MRIVEIRDIAVPMGAPMRNAVIDFSKMTVSAVAVVTDVVRSGEPVVGFGFNANGRYAQSAVIRERLAPRVLEAPESHATADGISLDPRAIRRLMMRNEKPGGHGERAVAVAALEIAVWDAAAKIRDMPLWAMIAEDAGNSAPERHIPVYAAGGYYDPDKGTDGLVAEMRRYLDEGYTQVKMKIGGASLDEDLARIEAVLALLGGDGARLAVDANGRFDEETALRYADAMSAYGLAWYEEPGDPLDFSLNAAVAAAYPGAIATGENLLSLQDARNLLRFGGMRRELDYVQFDPALAYGVGETIDIVAMMARKAGRRGVSCPTAATCWRSVRLAASHSAVASRIRVSFNPSAVSPTTPRWRTAGSGSATHPARASSARPRSTRCSTPCSECPRTPRASGPPPSPPTLLRRQHMVYSRARVFGKAKESKGAGGQRRSRLRERPPCRRHRDVVR